MHEHGVATLHAILFSKGQACQNAVIYVFKSKFIFFLRIDQVLRFCTKNNGIFRNDIDENALFYKLVRVIPH